MACLTGDTKLTRMLIKVFLDEMPGQVKRLSESINQKKVKGVDAGSLDHKTKVSSDSFTPGILKDIAFEINQFDRLGEPDKLFCLLSRLEKTLNRLNAVMDEKV